MSVQVVVGSLWGDEGKGKIIDVLCKEMEWCVRCHGGSNAGHVLVKGGKELSVHLLPTGALTPGLNCHIAGGVVVDPEAFLQEVRGIEEQGIRLQGRLTLSPYSHVVFPYHKQRDGSDEKKRGKGAIGTTRKGIGPCYSDWAARFGLRLGDFIEEKSLKQHFERCRLYAGEECDWEAVEKQSIAIAEAIAPWVRDDLGKIHQAINEKKGVLLEGAHGTFLDIRYGTYPYVTSSSTLAGGVCGGAGVGPTAIDDVLSVVKAYSTRVGEGPFPTEIPSEERKNFPSASALRETGTTTGRERRIGWLDIPLLKHSIRLNGVTKIALTKLDILDSFEEIKICTHYLREKKPVDIPSLLVKDLDRIEPGYEVFSGWREVTSGIDKWEKLPEKARRFVETIEELCGVPITMVSTGPGEKELIIR